MDMTFEAAPMAAEARVLTAICVVIDSVTYYVTSLLQRVASFACARLSRGGTSLNAVSPDYTLIGGTA